MAKILFIFTQVEGTPEAVQAGLELITKTLSSGIADDAEPELPPELPAAVELPRVIAAPKKKNAPKAKAATDGHAPEAAAPQENAPGGRVIEAVTAALQKGPATSSEVHRRLGGKGSVGVIYDALHRMRKAGVVYNGIDPADGQRKNFLKGAGR